MKHIAAKSEVESSTTVLTPAFSVNTVACEAFFSSQSPNALPPVKSISFTSGRRASEEASLSAGFSAASATRPGSKPASASTSWQTCTVIASGRTAEGCGFTITELPVTSDAKRPGQEFQVGNVLQPITSATPRGTTVNVFSIFSGTLPGFSQVAVRGVRVISTQA